MIVKPIKVSLLWIMVAAIVFASPLFAGAMGFEAEETYESVFVIYCGNAMGSGFALGENCVITNAHVIDGGDDITVVTYGGTEYAACVIGVDNYADIAVLAVADVSFPVLEVADISAMKTGEDIYAIGAPKGMTYTLTKGLVSAKERVIANQTYIQIDAAINQGNSGGPLLNDAGQVLGMNTMKMSDSEGIGLAIPINRICDYLKQLGIELDEKGNVVGKVEVTEELPPPTEKPNENREPENKTDRREKRETSQLAVIAVVVAALSLAANVVLAVLLIQEKKGAGRPVDPSERTEFDIDIWE